MRESGDRIRRERTSPSSPRLVLRRILVLSEGRQYREAANVLAKLGIQGLLAVANELPLDILVEGLPHSAQLLETLFNKLVSLKQSPQDISINAELVLWQLVRLFAFLHEDPTLKTKVAKLVKSLIDFQPEFHRMLISQRKALDHAIEGLGCHGLMTDANGNLGLTHLHVALKNELQRHIEAYKSALHRLDELGISSSSNDPKKPVDASHQRLLSLKLEDVQQRLIDNKTLLTLLDKPALTQLQPLINTLSKRVQNDKEALFCVSQLKRVHPLLNLTLNSDEKQPVASLLMSFSKGCNAVLDLMQQQQHQIPAPSLASVTMTTDCAAGNCNAIGGSNSPTCSFSDGYHSEPENIAVHNANTNNNELNTRKDVVGRYASLYYQSRPRALEALDSLPELYHATQLKSKILFSVVVLAFRTSKTLRDSKLRDAFRCLHLDARTSHGQNLKSDIMKALATSADVYPLIEIENQIRMLVCDTLKEYTCLESCLALRKYISDVARVTWFLINQDPPYELDTDFQTPCKWRSERHIRHHSSDRNGETVKSYLWPALMLHGNYVHKAVVITEL